MGIESLTGIFTLSENTPVDTYEITYTFEGECYTANTIEIKDGIAPGTYPTLSANITSYCYLSIPNSIELSATGDPGVSNAEIKWYIDNCQGVPISSGNTYQITGVNVPNETTIYCARWENNCGFSESESITITVNNPVFDYDVSYCQNDGIISPNNFYFGGVFISEPLGLAINSATGEFILSENTPIDTFNISYSYGVNCNYEQEIIIKDALSPNTKPIINSNREYFCSNSISDTLILRITGEPGANNVTTYWYQNQINLTPDFIGDTIYITGNDIPSDTTLYISRWENDCGVSLSDTIEIAIIDPPISTIHKKGVYDILNNGDTIPILLFCITPNLIYEWYGPFDQDSIEGATEQFFYPNHYEDYSVGFISGDYHLIVVDKTYGCVNNSNTIKLNIPEEKKSIQIYPSPAQNEITIQYVLSSGNPLVKDPRILIYNGMGNKIFDEILISDPNQKDIKIDISSFKRGMYFISLKVGNEFLNEKFFKL